LRLPGPSFWTWPGWNWPGSGSGQAREGCGVRPVMVCPLAYSHLTADATPGLKRIIRRALSLVHDPPMSYTRGTPCAAEAICGAHTYSTRPIFPDLSLMITKTNIYSDPKVTTPIWCLPPPPPLIPPDLRIHVLDTRKRVSTPRMLLLSDVLFSERLARQRPIFLHSAAFATVT
jgi:hypothetical protein